MKTELVFKLERQPAGYGQTFAPNCRVKIERTEGVMCLNYERRPDRAVGHFKNLRQEGELILADVELFENYRILENRFEFAIEGGIMVKNEYGEVTSVSIKGVAVLMHNKF